MSEYDGQPPWAGGSQQVIAENVEGRPEEYIPMPSEPI